MRADELTSGALEDVALDPTMAFVVFPAGPQPAPKARVFVGYLEQAVMQSQISPSAGNRAALSDSFHPRHPTFRCWRVLPVVPKTAFSGFPPVQRTDLEGRLWVEAV